MLVRECVLVLSATLAILGAVEAAAQALPNIIVVVVDDLRYDGTAATGHPFVETPNIDRIATEGISFQNAFATTPLCSPSRASLYSGRNVRSHHILGNNENRSVSDATLWNWNYALRQAGYHTGHVGKWHMDPTSAPRFGFEYWAGFSGQGTHVDPILNVDGVKTPTFGYTSDILTDYAIAFIESDHGGRPFALSLAFKAVHSPYPADGTNLPWRYRALYVNETIAKAPNASSGYTIAGKPMLENPPEPLVPPVPGSTGPSDDAILNQLRQTTQIDDNMGRLLDALDESALLDQTLIVFTSDNGRFWGEHGLSDKRAAYEESIRIPLLMRKPGLIAAGATSEALVGLLDIGPTLLELAGVSNPDGVEGESLTPLFADPSGEVRGEMLFEYWFDSLMPRIADWKALRKESWKYIAYPAFGDGYDELYDLAADPYEMVNRIGDPAAASVRTEMRRSLAALEHSLVREPVEIAIPGSSLDYEITEASTTSQGGIAAAAGSRANSPAGGRAAVLVFELPVMAPGHAVVSASPSFTPAASQDRGIDASIHADVWILGIGDASPNPAYIESDADTAAELVKLGENVLWWDRTHGATAIDPAAATLLAQYLTNFYAVNPTYAGGSYLWLRVNPDEDTGYGYAGWDIFSAEHPTSEVRPVLYLGMTSPDPDADGLSDLREQQIGTDPNDPDSDGDGLPDGFENGGGIFVDASLTGSEPLVPDTDGDGLPDGLEVARGTDPNVIDPPAVPAFGRTGWLSLGAILVLLGARELRASRRRGPQDAATRRNRAEFECAVLPGTSGDCAESVAFRHR